MELLRGVDGGLGGKEGGAGSVSDGEPAGDLCNSSDTTAFEILHLEAAFEPLLPMLLGQTELTELRTREDLNRIAAALRGALVA